MRIFAFICCQKFGTIWFVCQVTFHFFSFEGFHKYTLRFRNIIFFTAAPAALPPICFWWVKNGQLQAEAKGHTASIMGFPETSCVGR